VSHEAKDKEHVVRNGRIHVPEVGGIPPAVFFGVVPGKKEVGNAPGLTGVAAAMSSKRPSAS